MEQTWKINKDDPDCGTSCPYNVACKLRSSTCSTNMCMELPSICNFHAKRMAKIRYHTCRCNKFRQLIVGDMTARTLANNFYDLSENVIYDGGAIYCCSSCHIDKSQKYTCADIFVCEHCANKHHKENLVKIEESFKNKEDSEDSGYCEWNHAKTFIQEFTKRQINQYSWRYIMMTPNGPKSTILDEKKDMFTIDSARTCLRAASIDMDRGDFWLWLAGWYADCPQYLPKHI